MARRPAWTFPVVAFLGAALLRLWRLTWRVDSTTRAYVAARRARGAPGTIYLIWHSRILLGTATHVGMGFRVVISLHGDGEYIARTVERLDFHPLRGSTTRGGARALRATVEALRAGHDVIVTPDGPRGPRLRVQQGCVAAASLAGAEVVPAAFEVRRSRRLRSWDRFVLPCFFTKVAVRVGAPIAVPPDLDEAGIEAWRLRAETAMQELTRRTAEELGIEPEGPDDSGGDGRTPREDPAP